MDWTLEYDSTTQTLEAWGADQSATLSLQNQAVGTLTLHFPGMMDADTPFAYKGKVVLRLNEDIVFRGIALEPEREGEGNSEGITIQFVDAWWFLTQGTLTQTIYDKGQSAAARTGTLTSGSATVTVGSTTGLVVGMTVAGTGIPLDATISALGSGEFTLSVHATADGEQSLRFLTGTPSTLYAVFARLRLGSGVVRSTIAQTLSDIITACDVHHAGGVMQFGACHGDAFSLLPQPVDVQGTFETAMRTALGFAPDAIPVLNYATDPPTFDFYQRAAAEAQSVAFGDQQVMISQQIHERRDLLVSGVRIIYHRFLTDGTPATSIDSAGDSSGPGVIQVEMQLYAPTSPPRVVPAVVETQWLKTVPTIEDDTDWWFKNAELGVKTKDDITIDTGTPKIGLDPDAPENEGITGTDLDDVSGCDKRIVEGSIPAWLSDTAHLRYIRVGAFLNLTIWNDPDDEAKGKRKVKRRIILKFAATDLGTNLYENTVVAERVEGGTYDPENPPAGVAAAILAAQSVLQFQGSIQLTDDDCAVTFKPGQVLNVTGAEQEAWAAMDAQIQTVTHQIHLGTTVISFGPAEHLAPQDYLEIMRRLMRWKPALDLAARADDTTSGGGGDGAIHHPSTQVRFGITQADNVLEQKDVDSMGSIERVTVSGKEVWSDGTTTITVDCSGKVISIVGAESKQVLIDLDDLPASAVAKFRLQEFCEGGVTYTAYVLMTAPTVV
ncbi:MAG: hypothetical protein K9N47_20975 [Prosthecobacter sp.]|uniref:hypothetical protein n=1 Tax=Prosthecobacter sp. TaxID=1965333 RepID=UPI002633C3BF|nr:hypothetical protein [Prosthecobacter sp.]MCF7788609.1 hypothetical protein [Prosthecobacter sp.]